jgi:RecA/RadA recombinase
MAEKQETKVDKKSKKNIALDFDKLVELTQKSYGKKEGGLAMQICTGTSLSRPNEDDDFIIWPGKHWQALTHLKGIPFGRIIQISGKPDSGKSTHAMQFMKVAQDDGVLVILLDSEKKFSAARYEKFIGGDAGKLMLIDTNTIVDGVRGIAQVIRIAKEQNPDIKILVVWDSVGSSINQTEDSEETEDMSRQPGVTAKEIAWGIRKLNKLITQHRNKETGKETIAVLAINQTYANIGSVGQTEKGGSELYYLSSLILQLTRKNDLVRTKAGDKYKYGIVTRAKVKKNHLFDGDESISELNLVISASGVQLEDDVKSFSDVKVDTDEDGPEDE